MGPIRDPLVVESVGPVPVVQPKPGGIPRPMAQARAIARRVDHVNIRVPDPRPFFSLLVDRLRLPVLWSPAGLPEFEIAGVGLGNVHIEPTRFGLRSSSRASAEARLFTIALEPEPVNQAAEELARRGIPHTAPVPYVSVFQGGL